MVQKLVRTKRVLERQGAIVDMYTDYIQMPNGREANGILLPTEKGLPQWWLFCLTGN